MIRFVTGTHQDERGNTDFVLGLTLDYQQEAGQWVGVCVELGTAAFADTPEQADLELRAAVELQLNEMERLGHLREYLAAQDVSIIPIPIKPVTNPIAGIKLAAQHVPNVPIEPVTPLRDSFELSAR